jgi:hypothetical protein
MLCQLRGMGCFIVTAGSRLLMTPDDVRWPTLLEKRVNNRGQTPHRKLDASSTNTITSDRSPTELREVVVTATPPSGTGSNTETLLTIGWRPECLFQEGRSPIPSSTYFLVAFFCGLTLRQRGPLWLSVRLHVTCDLLNGPGAIPGSLGANERNISEIKRHIAACAS